MAMLRAGAIAALAAAVLLLAACSGGDDQAGGGTDISIRSLPVSTTSPAPAPTAAATATAAATVVATATATSTALPPTPTPGPSPAPTEAPATPQPPPPTQAGPLGDGRSVEVSPASVQQGGVFVVRLRNAPPEAAPAVSFAGLSYAMLYQERLWWAVIGVAANFPPGQQWVRVSTGADGLPVLTITVTEAGFPQEYVDLPPDTSQLLTDAPAIEDETEILDSVYAGLTPDQLWSGPFVMPVPGTIGDTFGLSRSFNGGPYSNHTGVDIIAGEGTPVVAANAGRVAYTGTLQLRGNTIIVDHGAGVFTGYHHLSQIDVTEGQEVSQGEAIGLVGATGLATAAHLHWEVIVRGVRVNPLPWTEAEIGP